jgi:hypothetical protein
VTHSNPLQAFAREHVSFALSRNTRVLCPGSLRRRVVVLAAVIYICVVSVFSGDRVVAAGRAVLVSKGQLKLAGRQETYLDGCSGSSLP